MSNWPALEAGANAIILATFGVPATFTPQDGSGAQAIQGILVPPALAEDYPPGVGPGASVLRLWVNFAVIAPSPQRGDQIVFNGANYVVEDVEADISGSAVLILRVT